MKPRNLSFKVIEGGAGLHRQPLVPEAPDAAPRGFVIGVLLGCFAIALALAGI